MDQAAALAPPCMRLAGGKHSIALQLAAAQMLGGYRTSSCTLAASRAASARLQITHCIPLAHPLTPQASLKADQAKLAELQQQEAQMEQSAEQVTQQVEELAAKMDDLKKQVG